MPNEPYQIDTIFRTDSDGLTIAVFPYEIWSMHNCTCYAYVGQHMSCSYEYVLEATRPCKDEAAIVELTNELQSIGYIVNRIYRRNFSKIPK